MEKFSQKEILKNYINIHQTNTRLLYLAKSMSYLRVYFQKFKPKQKQFYAIRINSKFPKLQILKSPYTKAILKEVII